MVFCVITSINPVPNTDGTIAVTITRTDDNSMVLLGVQPGSDQTSTDANIVAAVHAYADSLTPVSIPTNLVGTTED